jgi:hypothetical protein
MCLLGDAFMSGNGEKRSYPAWRPWALDLTTRLGFTEREFEAALGELIEGEFLGCAWRY